jgi:predicted ATPase/DNA-binding winged helix-turn-helix (wHTH) protein
LPRDSAGINTNAAATAVLFGPFRLLPAQRLLLEGNTPVRLGSRALEILIALIEEHGELVSKNVLMARVWPDTTVVEANLSVHVAALRRALRDGQGGNRYLVNMPGRGYRFVAPITLVESSEGSTPKPATKPLHNLPKLLTRLIGRDDSLKELTEQLPRSRLLTITGPGGIGKSAVALALAERQIDTYEHGVWLIDLAALNEPCDVASTVAAALGVQIHSEQTMADLLTALRHKRMLLVLDNYTRVIASAATFTTEVLRGVPGVQILATGREPLRAEAEHVHRLSQLKAPSASARLTAVEALRFPAVQLFVERMAESLGEFELKDADAPIVVDVCQKLDGIPLAIEFAAARAAVLGVRGVAARVEYPFEFLVGGHRTAPSRQQTMYATLEWSYGLLSTREQLILRRLALVDGSFTLHQAAKIVADIGSAENEIINNILGLVAKSLVMADVQGSEPRLWLLETTRAYARIKLAERREGGTAPRRRAAHGVRTFQISNLAPA